MFLIDTNVISEARKGQRADAGVRAFWAGAVRDESPLFLAAITIGELRRGVELIRHRGDHPQAQHIARFPEGTPHAGTGPCGTAGHKAANGRGAFGGRMKAQFAAHLLARLFV